MSLPRSELESIIINNSLYIWKEQRKCQNSKRKTYIWLKVVRMGTGYRIPGSSKLSPIKVGLFTVKRRVGQLAYELDLPKRYKFHPVISCIRLEQCHADGFDRQLDQQQRPLVVDGEERWIVENVCLLSWGADVRPFLPTRSLHLPGRSRSE